MRLWDRANFVVVLQTLPRTHVFVLGAHSETFILAKQKRKEYAIQKFHYLKIRNVKQEKVAKCRVFILIIMRKHTTTKDKKFDTGQKTACTDFCNVCITTYSDIVIYLPS